MTAESDTPGVRADELISRARTLQAADRVEEALALLDAAESALGDEPDRAALLRFSMHDTRTGILIEIGRLAEAEAEARLALQAALSADPGLAAGVYTNLGAIAQRTGDEQAAWDFVRLAEQLQEEDAGATAQITAENRARIAFAQGRLDEAETAFLRALELAKAAGLRTRMAACRTGLAAVYLQDGNPARAAKRLRELIAGMDRTADVPERHEAYALLGDAESRRGRFAAADAAYRTARELSRSAHERCRVDLRRAEMHAEWAAVTPGPRSRTQRLTEALHLAVPVLLATEALRGGFAPGPVRERWSTRVAAPARELAFRLAVTLGEAEILFALIENAAASATLQVEALEARDAADRAPVMPTPFSTTDAAPDASSAELPAAASGLLTDPGATTSGLRFAAPPRVVAIPGQEPALERFIRAAETEYGVRVRSDQVVAAW